MATIVNLSPENEAYNIAPTTSIAFDIDEATGVTPEEISVTINGVLAIQAGSYVNGYTGDITLDPYSPYYTVSIFPPYIFPHYVGFTIIIESSEFTYYFKTKDVSSLLSLSNAVNDLASSEMYIFAATSDGMEVIDIRTKENIAHVHRTGGFTSVWFKNTYSLSDCVYLGTSDAGVYKITLSNILGGGDVSAYCSQFLTTTTSPAISSNNIIKLRGYENNLALLMPNNVEIILSEASKYSYSFVSTISSGSILLTATDVYFTGTDGLHVKYNLSGDWTTDDFTYSTTSTPAIGSNNVNGIFLALATHSALSAYSLNNTLFIATADGLYIIKEQKGEESTASVISFGTSGKTYNILDSNICKIVISDTKISQENEGRFYVGTTTGSFYIINIASNAIFSVYAVETGNYGDFLNSSNLKAITSL